MTTREFTLEEATLDLRDLRPGSYLVHATNCLGVWGAGVAREIRAVFPAAYGRYRDFCAHGGGSAHVHAHVSPRGLAGRCLVIPPPQHQQQTGGAEVKGKGKEEGDGAPAASVVCLFTSRGYGRGTAGRPGRDPRKLVLEQTARALTEFRLFLDEKEKETEKKKNKDEVKVKTKAQDEDGGEDNTTSPELAAAATAIEEEEEREDHLEGIIDDNSSNTRTTIFSPRFNSGLFKVPWEETAELIKEQFQGWDSRWIVLRPT